jgi:Secretion system C-terminal sorting domain
MRYLLVCVYCWCMFSLCAQNSTSNWFIPGSFWKYSLSSLGGPGEITLEWVGEEMIGGQLCSKIKQSGFTYPRGRALLNTPFHQYFFARNDTVFIWKENRFSVLYDFTRKVGDTLRSAGLSNFCFKTAVIDSIGTFNYRGTTLRLQKIRLIPVRTNEREQTTMLYERLGGPLFTYFETGTRCGESIYNLQCYRDNKLPPVVCQSDYDPDYLPLPNSDRTWSEVHYDDCAFTGIRFRDGAEAVIYLVGGGIQLFMERTYSGNDACPNGSVTPVSEKPVLIGLVSQSEIGKTVNFNPLINPVDAPWPKALANKFPYKLNHSYKLYDFNIKVGDLLPWKADPKICAGIDQVRVDNGGLHRRYFFTDGINPVDSSYFWIEGVGGSYGLFSAYITPTPALRSKLNCFKVGTGVIYSSTNDDQLCDVGVVGTQEKSVDLGISVSPNPAVDYIQVTRESTQPLRWQLVDNTGRLMQHGETNAANWHIEVNTYPSGIYLLSLSSAQGQKLVRVAIQR